MLLKRIQDLEGQLQYAESRMKELPNFKLYEKKVKKTLKNQMTEKAKELRAQGLGYGKIAELINAEYHTTFTRITIKNWLIKSLQ
jgi:hypothetical protein